MPQETVHAKDHLLQRSRRHRADQDRLKIGQPLSATGDGNARLLGIGGRPRIDGRRDLAERQRNDLMPPRGCPHEIAVVPAIGISEYGDAHSRW
jgi:hypothetical protein